MGSLINCQSVTSYTSQEYAGDVPELGSAGEGTFEAQGVPDGITLNAMGEPISPTNSNYYYLIIKPMPGYRISRDMVSISSITVDEAVNSNFEVSQTSDVPDVEAIYPNGVSWYSVADESVPAYMSGILGIWIYDKEQVASPSCDNWVIVELMMQSWFPMPAGNWTINIDFDGVAAECITLVPVDENIVEAALVVTNTTNQNEIVEGTTLFVAQYYDEEDYASSPYNMYNKGINFYYNTDECEPPIWSPNGYWTDTIFEGIEGTMPCIGSYQPTCYTPYANFGSMEYNAGIIPTIDTICGQLTFPTQWLVSQGTPVPLLLNSPTFGDCDDAWDLDCGNLYLTMSETGSCNEHNMAIWRVRCHNDSTVFMGGWNGGQYLSDVDYPTIEPGDDSNMIPSQLSWYISIGNEADLDLDYVASIDVWKMVTVVGQTPGDTAYLLDVGQQNGISSCDTSSVPITASNDNLSADIAQSYLVSDSTENNNSDLDWDGISVTQIDIKTVKLTIPFRSGFSIDRFVAGNSGLTSSDVRRTTKIFLNVYPLEP